jgi:DNA-binding transcriptional MocR family regulator
MSDDSSARIVRAIKDWLATAAPGARLPTTRELTARHGASPVTVQKALRALTGQGLIEARPGVGTFVPASRVNRPGDRGWQIAALGPMDSPVDGTLRMAPNDVVALHSGYPDRTLLPERLVRAALTRAARGDISRTPPAGHPELQAWFAAQLGTAAAADVVITPGSQSGLTSIFRALKSRPLLIESPTYWGAILAARRAGAELVPIATGPNGPDPDQVARAFAETGARAFYVQPHFANPTGAHWDAGRILEIAQAHGAFLIEDDWAHDFGIDADANPIAARDDTGHVIYLRSLTKSVSPALRVGAVIARGPVRDRILADRTVETLYVSGVLQSAALDVVTQPGWQAHLRSLRRELRARRDLMLDSLRTHAPDVEVTAVPAGGLHLWLRLPDGTDVERVVRACEDEGVLVAGGTMWFPSEPSGPYVRLTYSGPDPSAFPGAVRTLGKAISQRI